MYEKLRSDFEAFITAPPYRRNIVRFSANHGSFPDEYCVYATQLAWEVWQAAWAVGVKHQTTEREKK